MRLESLERAFENEIIFTEFNQTQECFFCGLENGFSVYSTKNDSVSFKCNMEIKGGINHMAMRYKSTKLVVVGSRSHLKFPRNHVVKVNMKKSEITDFLEFDKAITGIRCSSDRIVVLFLSWIKVYSLSDGEFLEEFGMANNPKGLCALSSCEFVPLIVFPHAEEGSLKSVNFKEVMSFKKIKAHSSPLACIAVNLEGTRIATASEKGTLIRVFNARTGKLLNELRRGTSQANILCINFNRNSSQLCVSSDHGTVHVFYLTENIEKDEKNSYFGSSISGYVPGFVSGIASVASSAFLPTYINSTWSSYKFEVPNKVPCICGFTTENKIAAVCANGKYYLFSNTNEKENRWEVCENFLELKGDRSTSVTYTNTEVQQNNSVVESPKKEPENKMATPERE